MASKKIQQIKNNANLKKGDVIATIYGDDNYQIDNFDSVFKII